MPTPMSERLVAVYVRVSTFSQNEAGQRDAISSWLSGNRIAPERILWFSDQQTGDSLKRPGFERLQEAVFKGKVGTVVVFKLDRLSRKLSDGVKTLCKWCEEGVRVVSVTQQLDFNGTVGRLVASVLFAVAEMEQEMRRERQAVGIAAAKKAGKYRGGRKRGWTKANPKRARELREKGFSMELIGRALGVSKMAVSRYLKKHGAILRPVPERPGGESEVAPALSGAGAD